MEFLGALVTYGLKFILLGAVAFGAILLGGFFAKRKARTSIRKDNE